MASPTTNKALVYPANGADINTWDTPLNLNWNAIDAAFGGQTTLNATGASGIVALSATQYTPPIIEVTGTLTANVNYQFPSGVGGLWVVSNGTTGGFTVTFSTSFVGGQQLVVAQGISTPIFSDGANIGPQSTVPALPAGSNGWVQYNNAGALGASANFNFNPATGVGISGSLSVGGNFAVAGSVLDPLNIEANAQTAPVAVVFSATAMAVNCALSNVFATTFTANVTTAPTISNPNDGQSINWKITQDATGGRTMTWPVSFKWPGASPGVLSTGANAVDLLVATYFAATGNWLASLVKGFA